MTKRETTSLLVKLMGIYCLVQFAPSLTYILSLLGTIRDAPHTRFDFVSQAQRGSEFVEKSTRHEIGKSRIRELGIFAEFGFLLGSRLMS